MRGRLATALTVASLALAVLAALPAQGPGDAPPPPPTVVVPDPDPLAQTAVGGWIDHGYAQSWAAGQGIFDPTLTPVPAKPQIVEWLAAYGLDDELARGEITVQVADRILLAADGGELAGVAAGTHVALSARRGWDAATLAHEVGHWYQYRHPDVQAHGLEATIPQYERDADCIGSVLLAGTQYKGMLTDCTSAEIDLAAQVIAGKPLPPVNCTGPSVRQLLTDGGDPYTNRDPALTQATPTEAELRAARARAGITSGFQGMLDLFATAPPLNYAVNLGTPAPGWLEGTGVPTLDVTDLRRIWGFGVVMVDGVVLVDSERDDPVFVGRPIAELVAKEVGVSSCWVPQIAAAGVGFPPSGVWTSLTKDVCTPGQLLSDARTWSPSRYGHGLRPGVFVDSADDHAATTTQWVRSFCMAGLGRIEDRAALCGDGVPGLITTDRELGFGNKVWDPVSWKWVTG